MRQIVAIGGQGLDPGGPGLIERFLLSLTGSDRPRVAFVPTASGDSVVGVATFYRCFSRHGAQPSDLALFQRTVADLREFVLGQDAVYVGGGNTANMLAVWRLHGLDEVLREAYEQGVVLCGTSAGMNCWFEASVTDSFSRAELAGLEDGLGLLPGSACPHYDGEPLRKPTYRRLIAEGFPPGYAAEDGVALHFADGELREAVTSRPGAAAYRVDRDGERRIDARPLT